MANEQNLRPSEYRLTQEEAKRGGIASGKARGEKKMLRDALNMLLSMKVKNDAVLDALGIPKNAQTHAVKMSVAQLQEAEDGNTAAFNSIRDTIGEKPTDKTENQNVNTFRIEFVDAGIDPIEEEES